MKIRPGMYLGGESVTRLAYYIDGYYYATEKAGALSDPVFAGFQEWILIHYHMGTKTRHRPENVILFFERDERLAFWQYIKLLDRYLAGEPALDTRFFP